MDIDRHVLCCFLFSEITLSPTSIYMVRYSDVQLLLEEGRVELI